MKKMKKRIDVIVLFVLLSIALFSPVVAGHYLPDDYYSVAEAYAPHPSRHGIKDLHDLLMHVKLPAYREGYFDCSEASAYLEWYLEGAGFRSYIAGSQRFTVHKDHREVSHSWVIVKLKDGRKVSIDPTLLTEGNYHPPAIIPDPEGRFMQYTFLYEDYKRWIWEKNYYMTFSAWLERWEEANPFAFDEFRAYYRYGRLYPSPEDAILGRTVCCVRYYMPVEEFDWWNVEPFCREKPFSEW